jgi:hypothetical protein
MSLGTAPTRVKVKSLWGLRGSPGIGRTSPRLETARPPRAHGALGAAAGGANMREGPGPLGPGPLVIRATRCGQGACGVAGPAFFT